MAYPEVTFNSFDDLMTYINTYIVTNGMQLIEGVEHNSVENGLLQFIRQSPLNWQKAKIESSGGAINASRPVTVFMSNVPDSLVWGDNIYNQYVFINTTLGDIPLGAGSTYYDIALQPVDYIPARSIVNICKASNDLWIVSSVPSSGSAAAIPPLIGVVDGGGADDPVSGQSIFQSNKLIGLGSTNNGQIQIFIDDVPQSNYGQNKSFEFNNVTGEIDLDYNNSGNTWITDSSLYINLNQ